MIIRTDSTQKTSPGIMFEKSYPAVWRMAKEISNFSVLLSGSWFLLKNAWYITLLFAMKVLHACHR